MNDITTKIYKLEAPKQIGQIEKKLLESGFLPDNTEQRLPELINYYQYWYQKTPNQAKQTKILYGTMLYILQTLESYKVEK